MKKLKETIKLTILLNQERKRCRKQQKRTKNGEIKIFKSASEYL